MSILLNMDNTMILAYNENEIYYNIANVSILSVNNLL